MIATVIRMVEMISYHLTVDSTVSYFTVVKLVAKKVVKKETRIPTAVIIKGKNIASVVLIRFSLVAPTTKAAQVDSARDPKRSAPIPAISPTLSPTLSAMTPGFLGSSSGRPSMTFPARSLPTSAALVYIPPPTLPKRATVEPPRP